MPRAALLAATALVVVACNPHQARRVDDVGAGPVAVPAAFAAAEGDAAPAPPDRWWTTFGDPGLDALMARVEADNLSLRAAFARLDRARALARLAGAGRFPTLQAQAGAGTRRTNFFGQTRDTDDFSVGLAASYEVDLWGRAAALARAGELEARATALDVRAAGLSVAGEVATAWFTLRELRAQRALLDAHLERNTSLLEKLEARAQSGLTPVVAVQQQRQVLLATRSQVPDVDGRLAAVEAQLSTLAGVPPGALALDAAAALPDPPAPPALGLPAALLDRRPDVAAARLRVVAADERVGAAVAERWPSLRLAADTGFAASELADLISSWVYSLSASLVAPIFDGGARSAQVDAQRALVEAELAALGAVVLNALREVQDARAQLDHARRRVDALGAEVDAAQRLVDETTARFEQGLDDFLPVVVAIRGHQQTERALLGARRAWLTEAVRLHRALGGGWDLKPKPKKGDS